MSGYRSTFNAVTNPAPQTGSYTMILPAPDHLAGTQRSGFAAVSVDRRGAVRITGTLPDGKPLQQRTRLASAGEWPFYVNLYRHYSAPGSILGWLQFEALNRQLPSGTLIWTRPAVRPGETRTVVPIPVVSSHYAAPGPGQRVLNFDEGVVILGGGDLPKPLTNSFTLTEKNKVINTGPGRLNLAFAPNTGLFSGSFTDAVSRRKISFKGAVSQDSNTGEGLFITRDKRTGWVWLGPKS